MDEIEILSLLLQDAECRTMLAQDADLLSAKLGLQGEQIKFLNGLDPDQLQSQADDLLRKRIFEIRKFAPSTLKANEPKVMSRFVNTVSRQWPEGHLRHLVDARQFLEALADSGDSVDYRELNCIRFQLERKHIAIYLLRPGVHHGLGFQLIWKRRSGYRYRYCCWGPAKNS